MTTDWQNQKTVASAENKILDALNELQAIENPTAEVAKLIEAIEDMTDTSANAFYSYT